MQDAIRSAYARLDEAERALQLSEMNLERLREVAKAFYNQTIADTTVRISCNSSAVRDRVDQLAKELRPLLEPTKKIHSADKAEAQA